MAFDQSTRNRLARFVSDARRILTDEFTRQCKQDYGIDPDTGEVSDIVATQKPVRREALGRSGGTADAGSAAVAPNKPVQPALAVAEGQASTAEVPPPAVHPSTPALKEQHFTIRYGEVGHSYDSIIGPYLAGAKEVIVEDPYIRMTHQVQNLVRFCETVVKAGSVKRIKLITGYDDEARMAEVQEKILELQQSLAEADVVLEVSFNTTLHDREIRIDNGWVIKIGRGLDFYQKPGGWFEIGATDLSMRKCLETKVDIFRTEAANA